MGVYRTVRTHRIRFCRFGMQPSSFKAAGTKKPLEKSKKLIKMPVWRGFWVLTALKLDGRIPNLKKRILLVLPLL